MLKNIKFGIVMIIILFLVIVVMQNKEFLIDQTNGLDINLFFTQYDIPAQPMYAYFLGCFICGFLFASYFTVVKHFRARRIIKDREGQIESLRKSLESEKNEPTIDVTEAAPSVAI
jgi:uncharacterized integral membrane protein